MKVSIWQQWASNHSAPFTVMGKFSTPEEAQRVGGIFKDILREVATWKQQDYETRWQAYLAKNNIKKPDVMHKALFDQRYGLLEATEFEQRLAAQHGVEWPHTLEYANDPATAPNAVLIVDRAIIVAEDLIREGYTWSGHCPFEELMRKLGSEQIALNSIGGGTAKITLRGTAPDAATATQLMAEVRHESTHLGDEIEIVGLLFDGQPLLSGSTLGQVTNEGLTLAYTFQERNYGRTFAALYVHLQAHGCTDIEYTFETQDL